MGKQECASRRLSKPRSIHNSSSTLLELSEHAFEAGSPMTSSDVDYFGDATTVTSQGERRSKSKSRSRLRTYLYGAPTFYSQTLPSDEETESPSSQLSEAARKARKRLSRSGSVFTQRSSVRGSATMLSNASNSRLLDNVIPDDSDLVAEQIKQRAQDDTLAADQHKLPSHDSDEPVDALFPPIRRKSLFTPALATRNATDILRKPTAVEVRKRQSSLSDADREYYYNPSHPEQSPLSCLAALKLPNDGRATPSSLNVPNLGGLKLGTLHVTNGLGSPTLLSPAPDSPRPSPTASCTDLDDYHTASEGSISDKTTNLAFSPEPAEQTTYAPFDVADSTFAVHADLDNVVVPSTDPEPKPESALAIAHDYIAELGEGPFQESSPASNAKMQEVDFELESKEPSKLCKEETIMRQTPLLPLSQPPDPCEPCPRLTTGNDTAERAWTCDSGYHSNDSTDGEKSQFPVPQVDPTVDLSLNVDSELSLNHPTELISTYTLTNDYLKGSLGESGPSDRLVHTERPSYDAQRLNRKLRKSRPKQRAPVQCQISLDFHQLTGANIPRVPSAMALKHAERIVDFPLLEHTFPSSEHVRARDSPDLFYIEPVPLRFPSPFSAKGTSLHDQSLEPSRFGPHGSMPFIESPASECVAQAQDETDKKRPEVMHSPSWSTFGCGKNKEQKKLIKKAEGAKRKAEKEEKDQAKQLERERKLKKKGLYEAKPESTRSRVSSRVRGKAAERRASQCEAVTISDFGDVADSLRYGPYDIATNLSRSVSRERNACHPHQLGSTRSRPRSFVGMDDKTASEFAQARSRLRQRCPSGDTVSGGRPRPQTVCLDKVDLRGAFRTELPNDYHVDEKRQHRRRSWSSQTQPIKEGASHCPFNDRGGIPGKIMRPYSGVLAAPPIPALPNTGRTLSTDSSERKSLPASVQRFNVDAGCSRQRSALPGFWSNGSLEKRGRRPISGTATKEGLVQTPSDDIPPQWVAHQSAWRERRKSAGEALLTHNRGFNCVAPVIARPANNDEKNIARKEGGSDPSPWKVAVSPAIAALAGRYEGGFRFGYEKGRGLMGSAGTRNMGNSASRKGREVSKSYGLDLTDLPIFVAAVPT